MPKLPDHFLLHVEDPYEDYASSDNDFITEEIKKKGIEI